MTRHINAEGVKHIKQWEGLRTTAYQDSAGIWTIGYGHTSAAGAPAVHRGLRITAAEADAILLRDIRQFEAMVEKHVDVPLTDNQFSVLVSFAFNAGPGNEERVGFTNSTLLKKLNRGDYDAVPVELMKWVNSGGRRVQGLVNRRAAECGLWAKGEFVSSSYVGAGANTNQKVSKTSEGRAAAVAGIGVVGTAFADAASQIAPITEALPAIRWLFIGLSVIGVVIGLYATINRIQAENA